MFVSVELPLIDIEAGKGPETVRFPNRTVKARSHTGSE